MVQEWITEVPASATVLHLGDLTYRNNGYFKNIIAPKLTGNRKLLIQGNHDRLRPSFYKAAGFKIVDPFEMIYTVEKTKWIISFSHYPLTGPPVKHEVHLHGHIHNNGYGGKHTPFVPFAKGQINLSVEQTHYRPVNLKRLLDSYLMGCY